MLTDIKTIVMICCSLVFVTGCAQQTPIIEPVADNLHEQIGLSATFTGTIPCEDCDSVDIVLNLHRDNLYQLRKTYRSAGQSSRVEAQMGGYRFSTSDNLLILGKQKGLLKTYLVESSERLKFVGWEGADSASQIRYDLIRSPEVDPFTDTVKARGMLSVLDGQAVFEDCESGTRFDVAPGGDYETTMQRFMNTPHDQTEPILLSMVGRARIEPDVLDGSAGIQIQQFRKFYPNRDCEGGQIRTSLTGTYWLLEELDGTPVEQGAREQARYVILEKDMQMYGYAGCNRISGTYLVKGDVFLFNRASATRVACPEGLVEESRMLRALDETETYRLEEDVLILIDPQERVRARFAAGR